MKRTIIASLTGLGVVVIVNTICKTLEIVDFFSGYLSGVALILAFYVVVDYGKKQTK